MQKIREATRSPRKKMSNIWGKQRQIEARRNKIMKAKLETAMNWKPILYQ